jgi:hypothetical protein
VAAWRRPQRSAPQAENDQKAFIKEPASIMHDYLSLLCEFLINNERQEEMTAPDFMPTSLARAYCRAFADCLLCCDRVSIPRCPQNAQMLPSRELSYIAQHVRVGTNPTPMQLDVNAGPCKQQDLATPYETNGFPRLEMNSPCM